MDGSCLGENERPAHPQGRTHRLPLPRMVGSRLERRYPPDHPRDDSIAGDVKQSGMAAFKTKPFRNTDSARTQTSVHATVASNQVTEFSSGNAPLPTDIPDPEENLALIVVIKFADLNGNDDWDGGEFDVHGVAIMVDGGPTGGQHYVTGPGLFFGSAGVTVCAVDPGQHPFEEVVPSLWTPTKPTSVVVNVVSGDMAFVFFGKRPPMDWGDTRQFLDPLESPQNLKWLPAGYPVTRVVNGAFHVVDPATRLGPAIDEDPTANPQVSRTAMT